MPKSADAFRTISEVSEVLDTPAHVLRFWETRFTQVKPVKRAGGRRYYRPSDIELLAGIKKLLHEDGLTIRGVQKILKEEGVRHVAGLVGPVLAPAKADEETMTGPENAQVAAMEGATAEVLVQPSPDETPHWPEAPAPEAAPVMAGAAFPADPEDPAPETQPPQEELPAARKAHDRWNQPSLFDEPAPEAPMALDVEPDEPAPPLGEVVALNVERAEAEPAPAAPVAAAQPEAPRHAPHRIAETLRRIAPAGLSHDQRAALLAAQSRLVALREGLAAQPAARAD